MWFLKGLCTRFSAVCNRSETCGSQGIYRLQFHYILSALFPPSQTLGLLTSLKYVVFPVNTGSSQSLGFWCRHACEIELLVSDCGKVNAVFFPVLQVGPGTVSRSEAPSSSWPSPACSWCALSGGPLKSEPSLQVGQHFGRNLSPAWLIMSTELFRRPKFASPSSWFYQALVEDFSTGFTVHPTISTLFRLGEALCYPTAFHFVALKGTLAKVMERPAKVTEQNKARV